MILKQPLGLGINQLKSVVIKSEEDLDASKMLR